MVERTFSEYEAVLISQTPVDQYVNLPADLQNGALKAIYDAATAPTLESATPGNAEGPLSWTAEAGAGNPVNFTLQ